MIISGYLSKSNFTKIDVEIEVPDEIYANTEFPIKIRLINRKRFFPVFLMKVNFHNKEILFPYVQRGNNEIIHILFKFSQRGMATIEKIDLCSVFPFNFFIKCLQIQQNMEFIVFPEMKRCQYADYLTKDIKTAGDRTIMKQGFDSETIYIRDYVEGDPLKYIHWKATAKTDKLKTKELSSQSYKPIIIDFESFLIKEVEERISCITYIINSSLKRGIPVGLKIDGVIYKEGISRQNKINMLKALALYGK